MSKRRLVIIAAAAGAALILALYGLIARAVLLEQHRHAALQDQIAPLETALAAQQGGKHLLATRQAQLATAEAEHRQAQLGFPSEVDNIEVLDYVFVAAADHSVNLTQVEVHEPITVTLGGGTYRAFAYDLEVEGTLDAVSAFLAAVESGPIETLTLDQIRLQAQATPTPPYRASLVVRVYARP